MLLENSFEVPAPVDKVWVYLLDVERVVPCMPGAELTEILDDRNWGGRVKIKVGPVSMQFAGTVTVEERDEVAHRVVLKARGREQRGKGAASAMITSTMEPTAGGTLVKVVQELTIQGQAAQVGGGMIGDITATLTQQFADCLKANLEVEESASGGENVAPMVTSTHVKGGSLAFKALVGAIGRFFRRLLTLARHP
ncbi:MAG: carbon monoxide dehydrogenase [Actinobacteria bacterium]|nr:carbon monoxide dehydrogenase [Actinomycetota bacterium]